MPRKPQKADLRLISKVSKLYYHQNLTQQEIAERLHISRPKVSRLLQQAHEEGIVQVTVHSPSGVHGELEERLEVRYGLREAVVVDVFEPDSQEFLSRQLGIAAANYFHRTLNDGDTIGVSWGTTLNAMVNALQPQDAPNTHVVQLIGGVDLPEVEVHATYICRGIAQMLGGKLTLLHAPGIVDSQAVKRAILSDSHTQQVFDLYAQVNVAYVGIGALVPDSILMRHGSIMKPHDMEYMLRLGAVGDIALRFFDREGQLVESSINERVIGIELEQLKQVEHVVGVAGGRSKEAAIHGALQGGLVNVLITDERTALSLLDDTMKTEAEDTFVSTA